MTQGQIQISWCTTCKGRLYQLRETLPENLAAIGADEEVVLVDYASPDGLSEWVWANFSAAIAAGKLRFFEVLGEAPWHMARAKNLAHRLARGAYLFNLDADNFLTFRDRERIGAAFAMGRGCRQGTGNLSDGTPGRIGLARRAFDEIGGYDEGLIGVLVEDYDFIVRAEALGHRFMRLGPPERLPLQNDIAERLMNIVPARPAEAADLDRIGRVNFAASRLRLEMEGPRRQQNFATYRGRLNDDEVILDGLGNLHPAG